MALHTKPRSIFEAAAKQHTVRVICPKCGHWKTFDPHALWWLFRRKGWSDELGEIAVRFRCKGCAARNATVELSRDYPTGEQPPLPPHPEWKRAISRYRG